MENYSRLVKQARKGDIHAFAELYAQFYEELFRYAYYTLQNKADAEDVVSESVLAAFESIYKLRSAEAFRRWMFQIVTNQCKRKRKQYIQKTEEIQENMEGGQTDWDACMDIRAAFQRLTPEEQHIIGLSAVGGYKSREIGKILHMNPATVRSKLSRGLEKMRQYLGTDVTI